jgi:hypothetical protein
MGASGSGKTSLSLVFSAYGHYMGDEYAFVDLAEGDCWHESHPFQLKAENRCLLSRFESEPKLMVEADAFGRAYFISTDAVNSVKISREDKTKLKAIVFPRYDKDAQGTAIKRMPAGRLPLAILESLFGAGRPSHLLRGFLHLCADKKVGLYELGFGDCTAAAEELDGFLKTRRRCP